MLLIAQATDARQAQEWRQFDVCAEKSAQVPRRRLQGPNCLSGKGFARLKCLPYVGSNTLATGKHAVVRANLALFPEPENLAGTARCVDYGVLSWE